MGLLLCLSITGWHILINWDVWEDFWILLSVGMWMLALRKYHTYSWISNFQIFLSLWLQTHTPFTEGSFLLGTYSFAPLWLLETRACCVAKVSLKVTMYLRLDSNLISYYISPPSARNRGMQDSSYLLHPLGPCGIPRLGWPNKHPKWAHNLEERPWLDLKYTNIQSSSGYKLTETTGTWMSIMRDTCKHT